MSEVVSKLTGHLEDREGFFLLEIITWPITTTSNLIDRWGAISIATLLHHIIYFLVKVEWLLISDKLVIICKHQTQKQIMKSAQNWSINKFNFLSIEFVWQIHQFHLTSGIDKLPSTDVDKSSDLFVMKSEKGVEWVKLFESNFQLVFY